jgi:hypothetical protein
MGVKEYDPDLVDVIISGFPVSGFQEDAICSFEYDDNFYEIVKGVDGDVSRSRKVARTGKLTLNLMSTSQSNAELTALMTLGTQSGNGTSDVFPVLIRDRNGASLLATDKAWIEKAPNVAYGGKAGPRDWVLCLVKPVMVEAGVAG